MSLDTCSNHSCSSYSKSSKKSDKKADRRASLNATKGAAASTRDLKSKSGRKTIRRSKSLTPVDGNIKPKRGIRRNKTFQDPAVSPRHGGTSSTVKWNRSMRFPKVDIPAVAPGPSILKKTATSCPGCRKTARVDFDITEIREYPMILDEGNCDGPAMLTIDWIPQSSEFFTVMEYYLERSYAKENGGASTMQTLSPHERAAILIRAGCNGVAELAESLALAEALEFNLAEGIEEKIKTAHPKKKKSMFSHMKKKFKKVSRSSSV